jgi:hypothetical protein
MSNKMNSHISPRSTEYKYSVGNAGTWLGIGTKIIKWVRSISYDFFVQKVRVFKPTDSTFLAGSRLSMSIP